MTKVKAKRTRISPRLVNRVLFLRMLSLVTRKRRKNEDCDEDIYREMAGELWWKRSELRDIKRGEIINLIKTKLARLPQLTYDDILSPYDQLRELGEKLSLSRIEQIVLLLMVLIQQDKNWEQISSILSNVRRKDLWLFLSRIINTSERSIAMAMAGDGNLRRTGLLESSQFNSIYNTINEMYTVMEGLDEYALLEKGGWNMLVKSLFSVTARRKLTLDDYDYISDITLIASRLLKSAVSRKITGFHILLYGPPGTGKTELAWALANQLDTRLISVNTSANGIETNGLSRFRSYVLGQRLFKSEKSTIFLFDELEDVFPAHFGFFFNDSSAFHKGYMNEELEKTALPTIWTANNINNMDEAHLRRFSCIFEIPSPVRNVRKKLLENALRNKQVSDAWISRISECVSLTPAEIAQLGSLTDISGIYGRDAEIMMEKVFRGKMTAIGHKLPNISSRSDQIKYNLDYLNLDAQPQNIIDGLRESQTGTMLFYGPPGTGKSALAKHLSEQLDKPIIMKRASDLLSKWLGETEALTSHAFRTAEREKAILFLDEADSFLRNREMASHSWEVTQVNEMLVQMENFNGIFIAATNLINDFDMAAFRRFDMKIKFASLTAEQKWKVFLPLLQEQPADPDELQRLYKNRLARIDDLAMGDFRAALRNLNIRKIKVTAETFMNALMEESRFKNPDRMHKNPVGFITH